MAQEIMITKTVQAESVLDEICSCLPPEVEPQKVKRAIIKVFVGQWVYFPHRLMHSERNRELLERFFNGEAKGSLCREFKISRSQFHRIVKAYHRDQMKRRSH